MKRNLLLSNISGGFKKLSSLAALCGLLMPGNSAVAQCSVTTQPTYTYGCSSGDYINSLTVAGTSIPNMGGCNGQTNNYRLNTSTTFTFTMGQSYTYAYTTGSWSQGLSMWIDLDNNGLFDSGERLVANGSTTSGSGSFTIPTTATPGASRRMRFRCSYASTPAATAGCSNLSYGETEDFIVTIVAASTCSGTPTAGSITTTGGTTFCGSGNPTFTVSGFSAGQGGLSYQWQYSTNGGSTWINTGNATSSYNPGTISTTTQVRYAVTCSNSGITSYAGPVTITINPNPSVTANPGTAFTCASGNSVNLSLSGTATSYSWSPSTGLNTTTGGSVTASPTSTTVYTVTATLGSCSIPVVVPVNVAPLSNITASASPVAVCDGSSTQLTATQSPTNYEMYRVSHVPHTMTTPSTASFTSNDDGYATVALPFNFTFYGNSYSTVYIGTNGYIGFNSSITSYTTASIPSSGTPNDIICLFWHDMNLNNGGNVTYSTEGTTPNRKFIISYNGVIDYSGGGTNTGQVILYETSNYIDVLPMVSTGSYNKVLGIENSNGTAGVAPTSRNNANWSMSANMSQAEGYRFVLPAYGYAWTPSTNLSSASVYNPVASNNTTATTFSVTVTHPMTTCTATDTAAIVVNPLPTGSYSISADTICDGQTVNLTISGTANSLAYFHEGGVALPPVLLDGNGDGSYTSPALSVTTVYVLDSIKSPQGCIYAPAAVDSVVVNPRPMASLSGNFTVCNGTPANPTVNVGQGAAPWTITYSDGSNSYTQTSSSTSFQLSLTPSVTSTYTLTGMVDALCTSVSSDLTGSSVITVNPRPTASLSVPATTICDGTVQNLTVNLTGVPPYNFDITDGTTTTSYTNILSSTVTIPLSISSTTTYSITAISDVNCTGWAVDYGSPLMITVNPRPTAVISGSAVICEGNSSSALSVALTGTAPWNLSYFNGNSTVAVSGIVSNPHVITISPNLTASYSVVALTDGNGCSAFGNDMTGSGIITVNHEPNIVSQSGNVNTCAGDNAIFSVNVTGTALQYQWTQNGVPLSDSGVYSGTNSPTLQISDITGLGGAVYQLNVSGVCPPSASSNPVSLVENTTNQWTGTVDKKWSTPGNWACGILPTAATDVIITPAAPFQPEVDIPNAICRSLLIYPGSSVEIVGNNNALEVKTDIVNLGSWDADGGKLILSGTGPQNVPGAVYKELEIWGGSTKTFTGNAVVRNHLMLYSGYIALGQNNLVLRENALVSGGSASSFVITNGTGVVVGENMGAGDNTNAVLFPVGANAFAYTPVSVTNTGVSDDINVRVIDGVYGNYNGDQPVGAAVSSGVVNKTWLIHETIPGGSNATISPQWNFTEHTTNFNPASCAVSHYIAGDGWQTDVMSAANGFNPYTQTMSGVTSFSPFGVSSTGSALGLSLLSFKGNLVNGDGRLSWVTTGEEDVKVYELERSLDKGNSFTRIGAVSATGNGRTGNNNYNYNDASVAALGADRILYRLRMTDNSGRHQYSNIVALTVGKEVVSGSIDLYPNPVTGTELYVRMGDSKGEAMSIQIADMSGRVVRSADYAAGSYNAAAVKVDVSNLAQGIYMLRIVDGSNNTIETLKFNRQ
jgi:hypothetical protein